LIHHVLKHVSQKTALWYRAIRAAEFAVSVSCGVYLLIQLPVVPSHLWWVYLPTCIGGLILNYLLHVCGWSVGPSPCSDSSATACVDLLGLLDMNEGAGMLILIPGFLFEFVVLPIIWLIAMGFTSQSLARTATCQLFARVN
jgi:hypothetical protein